jgi:hypothetical protein
MRLLLKYTIVLGLLVAGILFLLKGLGVATPLVTYKEGEAHGIPVGILLLVMGVLLACLWKIRSSQAVIRREDVIEAKGVVMGNIIERIRREIRVESSLEGDSHTRPPRD